MTTAIGFKCQDGIVLGADSEISEGWGKYEESKIIRLNGECFFAYAGRTLVVKDRLADFQKASEGSDAIEVESNFRAVYRLIWLEARQKESEGEDNAQTDFLFAIGEKLFVAKGGDFAPIEFDVIGSGKDVARSTVDFFGAPKLCRPARLVTAFALRQAKEFTSGSGKKSEIWEMNFGDPVFQTYPFHFDYKEMEKDFEFLKHSLQIVFLTCPDRLVGISSFSDLINDVAKRLKDFHREKVKDYEKQQRREEVIYDKASREAHKKS